MAPVPQANRQDQAVRLRDICLELVKTHGERRDVSGYTVTQVALEPFKIWLTPWRHQASLDVWYDGAGKVLAPRLKDSDIDILGFRRGWWEGEFLALTGSDWLNPVPAWYDKNGVHRIGRKGKKKGRSKGGPDL